RGSAYGRKLAKLHDQTARGDDERNLRIAEFAQQTPDIAVKRLLPGSLPRGEIAADETRIDPRIDRRGIESEQAALAVTGHSDLGLRAGTVRKPVHHGE